MIKRTPKFPYNTPCRYCGAVITWTGQHPETGKYLPPQNPDGTPHRCKEYTASTRMRTLEKYRLSDTPVTSIPLTPEARYRTFLGWCVDSMIPMVEAYKDTMPGMISKRFQVIITDINASILMMAKIPAAETKPAPTVSPDDSDFSPEKPT